MVCLSVLMVGCSRHTYDPDVPNIGLDMDMAQTKALITPGNLNTSGSRMIVYDVHQKENGLDQYMDDQYMEYRDGQWNFTNTARGEVIQIPWTKKGVHNFFAYNTYDAAASKPLPVTVGYTSFEDNSSYTAKQQYLQIPSDGNWTLTKDNQFDFIYASATRDVATGGYAPVPMEFKHLFAAVTVEVKNVSSADITLNRLSFSNIKTSGNANVPFQGNVSYTLAASSGTGLFPETPGQTIARGGSCSLYASYGEGGAFLIWPHSAPDLVNATIELTYRQGSSNSTASVNLAENPTIKTWAAGNKYIYKIDISDNYISFDVIRVVDWINDDIILEE
ncbi:MAG: fimbrillin family protein [Bacteroidales bacterium]|nr:fimbrillin family protein [Bacteroidales bacterium]